MGHPGFGSAQPGLHSPREFLVFDPLRDDRIRAQTAHLVLLVVLEIALEPLDVAVAPNARIWVAMRSRNRRSWLMTTAAAEAVEVAA